jgi:putative transposase
LRCGRTDSSRHLGTVGDALDNALMESTIGLFKTEVIEHERPTWTSWRQVEQATASWVHWYNHDRLHSSIGHLPPVEHETAHYASTRDHNRPAAA